MRIRHRSAPVNAAGAVVIGMLSASVAIAGPTTLASPGASGDGDDASPTPLCTLASVTGPVSITTPHAQITNLAIDSSGPGPTLTLTGAHGATISNVHIRHRGGRGVLVLDSDDVTLTNLVIESVDAPPAGPHRTATHENLRAENSARLTVTNARLYRGSSGIYVLNSPGTRLNGIYGEDFRGPFPRGQFVQFDKSDDGLLETFHTRSLAVSWPEDNINIYRSANMTIRHGLIQGNNAPNGAGVIFDGGASSGTVSDVDTVGMANAAFSAYDGTGDVVFSRTRAKGMICHDQGRGKPASGGTVWVGHPRLRNIRVLDSTYADSCFQVAWPSKAFSTYEVSHNDFEHRPPVLPPMCWKTIRDR